MRGLTSVSFDQRRFPAMSTLQWWGEAINGSRDSFRDFVQATLTQRQQSDIYFNKNSHREPIAIIPISNKTGEEVNCRSEKVKSWRLAQKDIGRAACRAVENNRDQLEIGVLLNLNVAREAKTGVLRTVP